jgi:hypothetical protein
MMNAQEEVQSIQFFLAATNLLVDDFPKMEDFVLEFQEQILQFWVCSLHKGKIDMFEYDL